MTLLIQQNLLEQLETTLFKYQKEIIMMWERITEEIQTPPLTTQNRTLEKLTKKYPSIKKRILKQTAQERIEYIITERNKIVDEEINELKKELKDYGIELSYSKLLDITKIATWDWNSRKDTISDCLKDKLKL